MIPALPVLSSPTALKIYAVLILCAASYLKGCSDEKEKFDEYKIAVRAVGQAQEEWAKGRAATQRALSLETDAKHAEELAALRRNHSATVRRLRDELASRSIVPAVPRTAEGGPGSNEICFERDKLAGGVQAALDNLLARTAGVLQRGDERTTTFLACGTWALEQWKLGAGSSPGATR